MLAKITVARGPSGAVDDAKLQEVGSRRVRPQLDADRPRPIPVARPCRQPLLQQPGRHLGLDQVLVLRGSLAHRLGRRGPPGSSHQRRIQPVTADERLRRPVGRFQQPELPLEAGEGKHPIVTQRRRELLRGEAIDLMARIRDEVEDEAELPELLREAPHLVVRQPGGVPVERGRQVVGQHLVGILGMDRLGESPGILEIRGLRLHPQQVGERRGRERLGDRIVDPALDLVVALRRLGQLRIPGDPDVERVRHLADLRERRVLREGAPFLGAHLVPLAFAGAELKDLGDRLAVRLEAGFLPPDVRVPGVDGVQQLTRSRSRRRCLERSRRPPR